MFKDSCCPRRWLNPCNRELLVPACEAFNFTTARDSVGDDASRPHSKGSHAGNNYKFTRVARPQPSVLIGGLGKTSGDRGATCRLRVRSCAMESLLSPRV